MRKNVAKIVVMAMVGLLVLSVSGLAGCGADGDTTTNRVKLGLLWDFTGRASQGTSLWYAGVTDYLRMTNEENPIPGVEMQVLTYDTRSETARVPAGYVWLKGQGAEILSAAPDDTRILKPSLVADNIPSYGQLGHMEYLAESSWLVTMYGPPEGQMEVILQWVTDTWDGATKPKIGVITLAGVPFYDNQRRKVEQIINDKPDEFQYVGTEMVPTTTTAWAAEIARLKESDYLITLLSGPPLASFTREARARGYDGTLVGALEGFVSFWDLVRSAVSESDLDGIVCATPFPWWNTEGDYIEEMKFYLNKYRSGEVQRFFDNNGYISGWVYGTILVDALRRVADEVGPENVRGNNLFEALRATKLDVPVPGFTWEITAEANAFLRGVGIMKYSSAKGEFELIADPLIPPSWGG